MDFMPALFAVPWENWKLYIAQNDRKQHGQASSATKKKETTI